jgi:hypothetical protein
MTKPKEYTEVEYRVVVKFPLGLNKKDLKKTERALGPIYKRQFAVVDAKLVSVKVRGVK